MGTIRKKAKKTDKVDGKVETAKTHAHLIEAVFTRERRLTVSVGTSADFGKAKVGLSLGQNLKEDEDVLAVVDSMYDELIEKLEEKFDDLCEKVGVDADDEAEEEGEEEGDDLADDEAEEEGDDEAEEEGEEEGDDEADDGEEITEEEILKMKKPELVKLIEEEELDLDVKNFKKLAALRTAVVDAMFEDDDEDGDWDADGEENEDDDDWGDDD